MKKKKLLKQRRKKSLKKIFTPANTLPLQYLNSGSSRKQRVRVSRNCKKTLQAL